MTELAALSFATFFVAVGPIDVAVMLAVLSPDASAAQRRRLALRAVTVAGVILLVFAAAGESLFRYLGISPAALQIGGGILLLLIGINMVNAEPSGAVSTTEDENREARARQDISIFPLAMPLIAGPGAISSLIVLLAEAEGRVWGWLVVIGALVATLLVTLLFMLTANGLRRLLGVTALHVISRVVGILLVALAAQFILDGLAASNLLK